MENYKKILITVTFTIGLMIFSGIILLKVEVWAKVKEAEVQTLNSDLMWDDFLYQKTVQEVRQNKLVGATRRVAPTSLERISHAK